jgi:putative ABC transport system permease protein
MLLLALSALWQQKVRTVLTIAGVTVGTFALAVTLSLGLGFQAEVNRQLHRGDQLRQVWVFPNSKVREEDVPKEQLAIAGDMSEEKRERLRKAVLRRWPRSKKKSPPVLLTEQRVAQIRDLAHVEAVEPIIYEACDVHRGDRHQVVNTCAANLNNDDLRDRLVAGSFLASSDGRSVMVGEYLLYQWGIVSDADVEAVVGQKLRLVFPGRDRPGSSALRGVLSLTEDVLPPEESQALEKAVKMLRAVRQEITLTEREKDLADKAFERMLKNAPRLPLGQNAEESAAIEKALKQLAAARKAWTLSAAEKSALDRALRRYLGEPSPAAKPTFDEELTITGVLREYTDDDENLGIPFGASTRNVDLFLPARTAEEMQRRGSQLDDNGFTGICVTVDSEDNVKEVAEQIKATGLREFSLAEFVERLRASMTLSTFLTSFLAGVAVLVASLGITNTMFMTVLERTREIGVMKAVGARDRHIQMIFLVEGALLGVIGGGLGMLGGWLASFPGDSIARSLLEKYSLLNHLRSTLFLYPWWLLLGVPFFAGVVTTLAAVLPARRAARVNPITALRHE